MKKTNYVIFGGGHVAQTKYLPGAVKLKSGGEDVHVTFIDNSKFWFDEPTKAAMRLMKQSVKKAGFVFLDMNCPQDEKLFRQMRVDLAFVATPPKAHAENTRYLVEHGIAKHILVEKPFTASILEANQLIAMTPVEGGLIHAFDHHRARVALDTEQISKIQDHLKSIKSLNYYFCEDKSSADESLKNQAESTRDGAIEIENRVATLFDGLLEDGLPHCVAVLEMFGWLSTFEYTMIKAGRYTGVDGDESRPTMIQGETFAAIEFTLKTHGGSVAKGKAYFGKGIGGSDRYKDFGSDCKLLDVHGEGERRVCFDLRSKGSGAMIAYDGDVEKWRILLNTDPYAKIMELAYKDDLGNIPMPAPTGREIVRLIAEGKGHLDEHRMMCGFATYPGGMFGKRKSLTAESISDSMPPIMKRPDTISNNDDVLFEQAYKLDLLQPA